MEEQRKLLRPLFGQYHGRETKTMGDGCLVEFPSALDALRCGIGIQEATREHNRNLPDDRRLLLRIGVHLGDVVDSEGDISGDAVNVASRIEPLAAPGGLCISQQVYDHVRNKTDLEFERLGEQRLKNVTVPIEVFAAVLPSDGSDSAPTIEGRHRAHRLAVLPFKNISPDERDEYFADGLTEEITAELSQLEGLLVTARTSVEKYRKSPKPITEIGRALRVGAVLEGPERKFSMTFRQFTFDTCSLEVNRLASCDQWRDGVDVVRTLPGPRRGVSLTPFGGPTS